jgi:tetratricopeptide (TPR) repeat protein/uncharacterized FlaG/YvyC family protein
VTICNNCGADNDNNVTGYCYQCLCQLNQDQSKETKEIDKTVRLQNNQTHNSQYQASSGSKSGADVAIKTKAPKPTVNSQGIFNNSEPTDSQSVKPVQDQIDKDIAFEIKEVSFDESSVPGLISPMEHPDIKQQKDGESDIKSADHDRTVSMENELDLFQDDDLQFTMEQTDNGPVVSLTDTSEFQTVPEIPPQELIDNPADFDKPDVLTKEELLSNKPKTVSETQRISIADIDERVLHPKDEHPPEAAQVESKQADNISKHPSDSVSGAAKEFVNEDKSKSEPDKNPDVKFLDDALSGPRPSLSQGIAYISGGSISFTGGYKPTAGDIVTIADTAYKLKEKPSGRIPNYIKIGAGAVLFLIIVMAIFSLGSPDSGQIVGTLIDPGTNNIIPGAMISIKELNKTTQTNMAGFFIFDEIPPGIYTVELLDDGVGIISERLTVLENKTSTVRFSLPVSNAAAAVPDRNELKQTAQEEKPRSLAPGFMKLKLSPTKADVYYDGKYIGKGTQTFKVAAGSHKVTVKYDGYKSETKTVEISEDKIKSYTITLNKAKSTDKPEKKTDLETASELEQQGKYSEALDYYNNMLAKRDDNLDAVLGQARCLKAKGNTEESLTSFLKAVSISSDRNDINNQLEALDGILDINPNYLTALYKRGSIFLDQGEYFRAARDFSKVVEIDRRHLNALYKLGESYYKAKNYPAAIEAYLKIQELNFADTKPYAYIAKSYMKLDDKKNTKKYYEKFNKNADMTTKSQFNSDPEWQQIKMMVE